ncbi:unnamed protein product [Clonostachys rosea]|uniref:Zn(2)-C6 fungal-type domain-containing protein n=1 Tax=Bionectria ochroleuca TaxID=29856 RepID=A0ABY6U7Y4_BIOOC|nr:unnamed protein product [Clonostachys rosea]
MGDYYQHFLSSMSGAGLHQTQGMQNIPPGQPYQGMPLSMSTSPISETQSPGLFTGNVFTAVYDTSKSKSRKKSTGVAPGADSVKHRRTRSGCYTCRTRRVKCDEKRPVCDRCQKGSRECVYPDLPSSKGSGGQSSRNKSTSSSATPASPLSSTGEGDEDTEPKSRLETIYDENEPAESWFPNSSQTTRSRQDSETPSQDDNKSVSPAASSSFLGTPLPPIDSSLTSEGRPDWSHLPADFQYYLDWFDKNVTYFHYGVNNDVEDFFKTTLPVLAAQNEALLNALVGFAAYQATLQDPNGKLQDFLRYYNRSVTLLLTSFRRKEKNSIATLVTILQLGSIEEYLGDWVNLMGHQKAAFEVFSNLYTPQTAIQTPIGRTCLNWIARFDIFVAIMGGFPAMLPREYLEELVNFYSARIAAEPDELSWKVAGRLAETRRFGWDMAFLYARGARGQISASTFQQEHERLTIELTEWRANWDSSLTDPKYLVTDFGNQQPDPNDIVNPYEPGTLYNFPIFTTTVADTEWHSMMIMHKSQATKIASEPLMKNLYDHSLALCRNYETIEFWPHSPNGVITLLQPHIQLGALFLPQDSRHRMWARRKFAFSEQMGHIMSFPLRQKVARIFQEPSCARWWMPNDEGFTPVLQSIREFADERNAVAVTAQQASVREVRHIFEKLDLSDDGSSVGSRRGST